MTNERASIPEVNEGRATTDFPSSMQIQLLAYCHLCLTTFIISRSMKFSSVRELLCKLDGRILQAADLHYSLSEQWRLLEPS